MPASVEITKLRKQVTQLNIFIHCKVAPCTATPTADSEPRSDPSPLLVPLFCAATVRNHGRRPHTRLSRDSTMAGKMRMGMR